MILDYFLGITDSIKLAFANSIPFFGLPGFWSSYIPELIQKIMDYNDYLPIMEAIVTVIFCLTFTLSWKIVKIVLGVVQVNLGA